MTEHPYILATAGHVDHGKSALVKALTGTDPDRLPEEKARGITIDLGFAHLELAATIAGQPARFSLGIVDVPGHEDFVKNMVAGVGSIDLALLVVAADDGWMPQTEEHLQILTYLGVTRAVVALTKMDLAEGREAERVAAVRAQLDHSPFAQAPVVPTSVVSGRGLDELKEALAAVLANTPPPRDLGKPRLPVDRVFVLRGVGTVVTGTLIGGALERGQGAVLQPGGRTTRIRGLQNYNQEVARSLPGTRTAVNLADVEARSETDPTGVARGDVLTLAELEGPTDTVDVWLEKSARLEEASTAAARPLKDRTLVRVHYGSANYAARVFLRGAAELVPGAHDLAQLRFEAPVYVFAGDRFIVRDWSEQTTLAGGLVLDPEGDRKHWRSKAQARLLEERARGGETAQVYVATQLARDGLAARAQLLVRSRFSAAEVAAALAGLLREGRAKELGALVADAAWWRSLLERAGGLIDAHHGAHPDRPGLAVSELRVQLAEELAWPGSFEALLAGLCANGFQQSGTALRRLTHRLALPPHLRGVGERLRAALTLKPLEPPSRKELASDPASQQALRFLINAGEAVEVSADLAMSAEGYARAVDSIKAHLRQRGQATVSELRQSLGSSRRILVPLLEKLDREGVTRRQGDLRVPGKNA
ncbi:MAG: selenocysteine-specific translation elongation factor [Verrucomicrobia bacterium]|nr:selenocysteine-specific translation elongation factor [Verrucomicrobiota bacterium]